MTLENTGGTTISNYSLSIPPSVDSYFTGDCKSETSLVSGGSCTLSYDVPSNSQVSGNYDIEASGNGAKDSPVILRTSFSTLGHFQFEDSSGHNIQDLDLARGDQGDIRLVNTGGGTNITGFSLSISAAILSDFTGDCKTISSLASGADCSLHYDISQTTNPGTYEVKAEGTDADNSPTTLTTKVSTQGHFEFENAAGDNLSSLDLKPGDQGTITLKNTGGSDITGFSLSLGGFGGFDSGSCLTATSIVKNGSCDLHYAISSNPTLGTFNVEAQGTGADNSPRGLSVRVRYPLAYVVSNNSNVEAVKYCRVDQSTGNLTNCTNSGHSFAIGSYGVTLNSANTRAYITNSTDNTVVLCTIDSDGGFSGCASTGSNFNKPKNIALHTVGANTFAYVANSGNDTVSLCAVDPADGTLSGCASTGSGFSVPYDVTFRKQGSGELAYVGNNGFSKVTVCEVYSATGVLDSCVASGPSAVRYATGATFNMVGDLVYVSTQFGKVNRCTMLSDGGIDQCIETRDNGNRVTSAVRLNTQGSRAYMTLNYLIGPNPEEKVTLCDVSATGFFESCRGVGGDFSSTSLDTANMALNSLV